MCNSWVTLASFSFSNQKFMFIIFCCWYTHWCFVNFLGFCLFSKQEEEFCQYNSFLYWRAPLPAVDLSDIQNLDEETPSGTKTAARTDAAETEMETWSVVSYLCICPQETCFHWDSGFIPWVDDKHTYAVLEKSLKRSLSCLSG